MSNSILNSFNGPAAVGGMAHGAAALKSAVSSTIKAISVGAAILLGASTQQATATTFTKTVPGTSLTIPSTYPQAGGVVIVLTGANGNVYYQYVNPSTMFQGMQNTGSPSSWRGNPFQIGPSMALNCGPVVSCSVYLGGGITSMAVRFTAHDGDNKSGNFDYNDLTLRFNGYDIANWSTIATETTNTPGNQSLGSGLGFGNNTLDTGWFQSTNTALLANVLSTGTLTATVYDRDPNDNYWDFKVGNDANTNTVPLNVAPGVSLDKAVNPVSQSTFLAVGNVVNYTYAYRNIGSVWVENIAVSDNKIPSVSCPTTPVRLNPGDTKTCTGSYTITQADVDAGFVTNIATANGTPQAGTIGPLTDTVTITGPAGAPGINLIKTAAPSPFGAAGTTATFGFQVQNTGNVTLSSVVITDPMLPALSCTIPSIAPGITVTASCSGASKTVTVADVDAATISNTAAVTARAPNGTALNDTANATIPGPARVPGIALRKTTGSIADTNGNGRFDAGDTQNYDFVVTNTGNVTLTAVTVSDPGATVTGGPLAGLVPNAINATTFKASRVITQAEIDAGSISNQASVSATPPVGVTGPTTDSSHPTSNTANGPTVSSLTRAPALTLEKSAAEANFDAVSDAITYTYLVTNTGNVTLTVPVTISDNKIASGFTCPVWPVAGLAPLATYSCTASYNVIQADLDAGKVTNIATAASGTATTPVVTSPSDTVTVPAALSPGVSLVKSPATLADTNGSLRADAGDTLTYTFTVKNTGNVTLSAVTVSDPLPGAIVSGSPLATLGAGLSDSSITATYVLTQADINAGTVANQASVTANPPLPAPPVSDVSDPASGTGNRVTNTSIAQTPSIALIKAGGTIADTNNSGRTDAGDIVTNLITVTNTGTVTLTNVTVTDAKTGVTLTGAAVGTLLPGVSNSSPISAAYVLTQADIDAGTVSNQASVSGTPPSGPLVTDASDPSSNIGNAPTSTNISGIAAIRVVKTASTPTVALGLLPSITDADDTISYNFTVTNTGTVTLSSVAVSDIKLSNLACNATTLVPGASTQCAGAPYVITLAEMNAGKATNTATASGLPPTGPAVSDISGSNASNDAPTEVSLIASPAIALIKTAGAPTTAQGTNTSATDAGDTIEYAFEVTNTGNVTLSSIAVDDPKVPGISCLASSLAPGATTNCSAAPYVLTLADMNRGLVENQAGVEAQSPNSAIVADDSDPENLTGNQPTQTLLVQTPSVALLKTASAIADVNGNGVDDVGDKISYNFSITNTGTVTLYNLKVTDALLPVSGFTLASLAPGSTNVSAFYAVKTLTQADVDAGSYSNTASVSGVGPSGPVQDNSDPASLTGNAPTIVTITPAGSLRIAKTADIASFAEPTETITYTYVVTNDGNITLNQPFTVADDKTTVTCPSSPANLGPKQSLTCSASYTTTQADVDAGGVTNIASASSGTVTSPVVSVTVPSVRMPKMDVAKSTVTPVTSISLNDVIYYQYNITNTGNVTLTAPFTITDNRIASASITCPTGNIAVSDTKTCTASYTITGDDILVGVVTNTATAGNAQTTSPGTSTTIPAGATPALSLSKTTSVTDFDAVGDIIEYSYEVDNVGNVDFARDVVIVDDKIGTFICVTATPADPFEDTDSPVTCTAQYSVVQADLDRGYVTNNAVAQTLFGASLTPVASAPQAVTVNPIQSPAMVVTKTANAPVTAVGQVLTYTIDVENTGNVTLSGITISDPLIASLACSIASLAPGANDNSCQGTYRVTQADIDAGQLINTAFAQGITPQGISVSDSGVLTLPMPAAVPSVVVSKATPDTAFTDPGQILSYSFTVTNSGNITLSNLEVTDPLIPGGYSCTIAFLAPGDSDDTSCSVDYTVTQDDIDRGFILNTANVTADAARGTDPTDNDSVNSTGPAREPALLLNKSTNSLPTRLNDTLIYQFEVYNVGNVTVSGLAITDAKCATAPALQSGDTGTDGILGLAEVHVYSCTSIPVTQPEVDAGVVNNSASVTGTPAGGTLTPANDNVATTIPADAKLTLVKTAGAPSINLGTNPTLTDAGDKIKYTFAVANTGTVSLNPVSVSDAKVANIVCVATSLAPGLSTNCTGDDYVITLADMNAGSVTNTATASGTPPTGDPVTDRSGTDPTNNTDTVTPLTVSTVITLVKTAGVPTIAAGLYPDVTDAGDTIVYSFTVTNSGTVTLSNIAVDDTLLGAVTCQTTTLAPTETTSCSGPAYTITNNDMNDGFVSNTATATGKPPIGLALPDAVDQSGSDADSNLPTMTNLPSTPKLALVKTASVPTIALGANPNITDAGDTITYSFLARNEGPVILYSLSVFDPKLGPLTCNQSMIIAGASTECTGSPYTITVEDMNASKVTNSAAATAFIGGGGKVEDTSDDPANPTNVDPDNNGNPDDPTVTNLTSAPRLTLVKTAGAPGVNLGLNITFTDAGDTIKYSFAVVNSGTVTLNPVTVSDAKVPNIVCLATSLAPGDATTCAGDDYVITLADMNAGSITNTATASGTPPTGDPVTDRSGTDPTNNTDTVTPLTSAPSLTLVKTARAPSVNFGENPSYTDAGDKIKYDFVVKNEGTVSISTVAVSDAKVPGITCGKTSLAPNETTQCSGDDYVITPADMTAGSVSNTASVSARAANGFDYSDTSDDPSNLADVDPDGNGNPDDATVLALPAPPSPDITMQKIASLVSAKRGDAVTYTLRLINNHAATAGPLTVTDTLPAGFTFIEGSAQSGGTPLTPGLAGSAVTFQNLMVNGNATRDIQISVRIGDVTPGSYINRVQSFDSSGNALSNVASASVTISSEAVFDCGDVIGKVFDDKDRDGKQDEGEPGIAGARLATVRGVLITTDAFGRFNVPCAELPDREVGSNFILKLDPRTLPTGYSVTTENPRVVRLTAGKLTKLNFGAAQAHVLKVELSNDAFVPGETGPTEKLQSGIETLINAVRENPSVIQLTYKLAEGEARSMADNRMKEISIRLRSALKKAGLGQKVPVETKVISR